MFSKRNKFNSEPLELKKLDQRPAEPENSDTQDSPAEPKNPDTQNSPVEPENLDTQDSPAELENPDTQNSPVEPKNLDTQDSPGTRTQYPSQTYTDVTRIVRDTDTMIMKIKSPEESPASLLLLNGPKDLIGATWALKNTLTSVGRSSRLNDITIPYNSLSKVHFQIIKDEERFFLVDLKSTNKTYLNDDEILPYQKIPLENNSYIRASHLIFKFLDEGSMEAFSTKQLLNKSQVDPLTQAGNRRLLKTKGPEYFFSNQKLSLIVFDVDDFKSINDKLGHIAGDHVLKTLSKYVLEIIRENDLFIRYGGDEFCIFTPNPLSVAKNISKRIKTKLQSSPISFKEQKIHLDISVGLAEKEPSDKGWENIYHRADQRSYEEKRRKKAVQD